MRVYVRDAATSCSPARTVWVMPVPLACWAFSSRSCGTDTVILRNVSIRPPQYHDGRTKRGWLRGLDSNQDNQLQRLACYQLHYPGNGEQKCSRPLADLLPPAITQNSRTARGRLLLRPRFVTLLTSHHEGEVSERFKEHAWKACVGEILPWVRIPPSPPSRFAPHPGSPQRDSSVATLQRVRFCFACVPLDAAPSRR